MFKKITTHNLANYSFITVIQDLGNTLCKYCYLDWENKLVLNSFGKIDEVVIVGEECKQKFEILI